MMIYIHKNNSQMGPLQEVKVLEMLSDGRLSPGDPAIRQGDKEWRKLENFYPNVKNINVKNIADTKAAAVELPAPKKSRKGLLVGCGGFSLTGLAIAGVLGIFTYRNMNPADSAGEEKWNQTAWKTDGFYRNPLSGFVAP